jgi:hypothetical protein
MLASATRRRIEKIAGWQINCWREFVEALRYADGLSALSSGGYAGLGVANLLTATSVMETA